MTDDDKIKKFNSWVAEAQWGASEWRKQSWRDCEMMDGGDAQWSQSDYAKAEASGIDILTINRTFPTVRYILGSQAINRFEINAKGRTQDDSEISQVMTEGVKFVMDQSEGEFKVSQAFHDAIVPGFGCLNPCLNPDPRKERLQVKYQDWKELWWDPFASPWFNPDSCRYLFTQKWMDLDDLIGLFPERKREIQNKYEDSSGSSKSDYGSLMDDEANSVEEQIRTLSGSDWADSERKRVRPVSMWYPELKSCIFALFADGRVIEIKDDLPIPHVYQIIEGAHQVVKAVVKKMQNIIFFDDLALQDVPTPYPHDQYPFIPFIGYIDRYRFPYGVPRQIRGQDEEVNKRRSMALALLKSRRVFIEKDAVGSDETRLQEIYEESNKLDGFMVLDANGINKVKIDENIDLASAQVQIMQDSEREVQEIAGTNTEQPYSKGDSGVAIEKKERRDFSINASLFDNMRRSMKLLGDQVVANIQGFWHYEKVLRITDRLTGAERFAKLNERIQNESGVYEVKNNITQGKYDTVVSEMPATDTIREQNLNLIIEWVKKSPPETIPLLMNMAFEMSNLPNKEQLLAKIKPMLGVDPSEDDMPPEELKAKVQKELEAQQKEAQQMAQIEKLGIELELTKKTLENQELKAKIQKLMAETAETIAEAQLDEEKVELEEEKLDLDAVKVGVEITKMNQEPKGGNGDQVKGTVQ